ncbi:hypothetical protein SARC_10588 [Sphaeroforma arctica JP610]|uniref:Methyltransferase type 11 domain-containing protein n=1 Tax=Sphaeroforma arctica JP610 TaxID=667725 RepID=A0A0L0FJH4_9EUKA|nr:hypothetical protein SARC_10588 [Sphaeroforma arctica JP610]KNC76937.1 hypothetical protein SARC_10588 [Sphaeroforma arctica JP610]|eukprot:XP_014150839.1 hypothetical protein SARC_10588 [Sphaeroforma arctica JP610]
MLRLLADDGLIGPSKGLDVEEKMVEIFQKHINENEKYKDVLSARLLKGIDGSDAGIAEHNENGTFDVVTSTFVLGHVFEGNVDKVINSIARCVKVGGHLVISEFESGIQTGEDNAAHVSDGGHFHTVFTEVSMTEHLEKRGFDTKNAVVIRGVLEMGKGDKKMKEDFFRIFVEKK